MWDSPLARSTRFSHKLRYRTFTSFHSRPILSMNATKLSCLTLAVFLSASAAKSAELLGYYAFEDNYTDSTGNGNDAEESQNPDELSFTLGFRGKGVDINDPTEGAPENNNSGGSVDIPIDANPGELPGVTFGGWVNIDENTAGEFDGFMATDNGGWDRGITVNAPGSSAFGIASGAAPVNIGDTAPGTWQFVVGTFDFDEGFAWLYVGDDNPENQMTESDFGDDLTDLGEPVIELGRYDNQDLDALVDDVFVFDSALNEHEVNAIRNLRLSDADLSPAQVADLLKLFDDGEEGEINGATWKPIGGLPTDNPGAMVDQGDAGVAIVLDGSGNGMLGDPSAFVPREKDSDGDMMDDEWERAFFGNLDRDGTGDFDEDGVLDLNEFELGLVPDSKDTDSDGLEDGAEITAMTNPLVKDTDGDGLEDGPEVTVHMTNPTKADSDDDTFNDDVEIGARTDPNDPNSKPVPAPFGLIGYFEFEDELFDSSQNGNTAEIAQNPDEVTFTEGFRGRGLDINDPSPDPNSGGLIDIPVDANPDALPSVTFGGWVNVDPESEGEFDGFMAIDNGGWDRGITVNAQTSNSFGIASGAAPINIGEISFGDWQYVVGTFDFDESASILYVGDDDASKQTTESDFTEDLTATGELDLELGRYDNQDLDARVDDIFVFDSALDAHHANAVRNLRLSSLDYSPSQAAQLFEFFAEQQGGAIAGVSWTTTTGLDADVPGAVVEAGGSVTVVLDDAGNGMVTGSAPRFAIKSIVVTTETDKRSVTLTWNSRAGRSYALEAAPDIDQWLEVDDGIDSGGTETSYTESSAELLNEPVRYYRVREVP